MVQRALPLAIALMAATCPLVAAGQTARVEYGVCASQPNLQTIYVSGVLQGPASSAAAVRAAFTQFLAQRYGYKGGIACAPAANAAAAEKLLQDRASALRNAKKNVIETGWTDNAVPAATLASSQGASAAPAAAPATARAAASKGATTGSTGTASSGAAAGTSGAGSGASGNSGLTGVLASIFGSGGGSGTGASGGAAKPQSGAGGSGGSTSGDAGGGGAQSALSQVSGALSSAFAQKPASAGASTGGQPAQAAADGLGSAQAQNTRLVVYGCGRQDTQVACVTDLTNQDKANTLVQSADIWKDAFIVDDRGDRHQRSRGFFLNIDGDQRTQLDISYNKSARFIIMFDDVQAKIQKVSLRSKTGGLDVEDITLITSGTGSSTASNTASDGSH